MAAITEDYVSFETAKLLKEKGFDAECDKCYAYFTDDDIRWMGLSYPKSAQVLSENRYPCITLQMAMKWLREICGLIINIEYKDICPTWKWRIDIKSSDKKHTNFQHYDTYEQAVEAAIKYSLKHLI